MIQKSLSLPLVDTRDIMAAIQAKEYQVNKLKRILCAIIAFVLVGTNLGGSISVFADEGDPTVRNPEGPTVLSNGAKLYKTAASVPGYANMWRVTLRIETPIIETKSDTVLVIDNSNSMNATTNGVRRISEAISAAKTLAEELLPEGNTTNKIAVVSFNGSVTTRVGFSSSYSEVETAIDATSTLGAGTHTQAGMHTAANLIKNSTANIKNIVLLSDGEPSYSYAFTDSALEDDSNFVTYTTFGNTALQTSKSVAQSVFDYDTRAGGGNGMRTCIDSSWPCAKYYNHGNSAIAEASYYKALALGDLYTIAVGAGDNGEAVLSEMASSSEHYYEAEDGGLDAVFQKITGKIMAAIESANVHDVMGEGVIVENAEHSTELDWKPKFTYDSVKKIYWAEYTYEVEANEHILDENSTDGFHPLNKNATLTYNNNQTGSFPVPYVKPFFVNVTKEIDGQTCGEGECIFDFKIEHPAGLKETDYSVEAGKTHRIVESFPLGDYTLTELGETNGSSNPVKFENYLVSYTGNQFTIAEQHADHIDVTIKNKYETVDRSVTKKWEDDDDRDGLRSNYNDLYVVVKDGNKFVAYQKINGEKEQNFEFTNLPKNRNGAEITYTIGEATGCTGNGDAISCRDFTKDEKYVSSISDGVITNTHKPDETTLEIKKKWDTSAGTLPSTSPLTIMVEVSNDKNDTVETVTLKGNAYQDWSGSFKGFTYEGGQKINYTVTERKIGEATFGNGKNTLYVYEKGILEGKWVASYQGAEVTNTWTPAKTTYTGAGEFEIEKLDQGSKPISGVTFKVGDKNYTTGSDGKAKVEFSASSDKPEDSYTFNIKETNAPDYYNVLEGTEVLTATTNLKLDVDEENLTNAYTKTFAFSVKTAADGYVWQGDTSTLVVSNQALAKELVIEKEFGGITATAFENNSKISFEVTGPDGFTKVTLGIGDNRCKLSDSKLTCTISGNDTLLPVGKYTVTEKNAGITNFTYKSEPASGEVSQTAKLGDSVKFSFKNTYESVKTASYKVAKVWDDDTNRDGIQPGQLEVTLYAGKDVYGEPVLLTANDWSYEWNNLPLVNENAETIQYSVREAETSGYTSDGGKMVNGVFTFTNTHEPELINEEDDDPENDGKLTVQKIWNGEGYELVKPSTVTIELHAKTTDDEGKEKTWMVEQPVTISEANEWAWTFTGLYRYDNGLEITYTVEESKIGETAFDTDDSVIVIYRDDAEIENGKWEKVVSGTNITNIWTRSLAKSFTIKKTTVGLRAEVLTDLEFMITGPEDFGDEGEMTLKIGEGCEVSGDYEITCTVDGKVPTGVYTVEEGGAEVENFTLTVSGDDGVEREVDRDDEVTFEIENEYVADTTFYDVVKIWEDEHDKDGKRPEQLAIELLANGEVIDTINMSLKDAVIISEEIGGEYMTGDVWVYEWEELPYVDEWAEIISYTVEELLESDDYTLTETESNEYYTLFVNTHEVIDPCADGGGCGGGDITPPETGRMTMAQDGAAQASFGFTMMGGLTLIMMASFLAIRDRKKR